MAGQVPAGDDRRRLLQAAHEKEHDALDNLTSARAALNPVGDLECGHGEHGLYDWCPECIHRMKLLQADYHGAGAEVDRCREEVAQNGGRGSLLACFLLQDLVILLEPLQLDDAVILVQLKAAMIACRDHFILRLQVVVIVGDPDAMYQAMVREMQYLRVQPERCEQELERLFNSYKKTVRQVLGALAFESRTVQERAARQARRRVARQGRRAAAHPAAPAPAPAPAAGEGEAAPGPAPADPQPHTEDAPAQEDPYEETDIRRLLIETSDPIPDGDGKWQNEAETVGQVIKQVRRTFLYFAEIVASEIQAQGASSGAAAARSKSAPPSPKQFEA